MTTFQIIGIVIVALIGLGIFYAIYRIERHDYPDQKKGKDKPRHHKVFQRRLFVLSRFVSTPSRRDDTIVTAGPDPWQHTSRPAPKGRQPISRRRESLHEQTIDNKQKQQ